MGVALPSIKAIMLIVMYSLSGGSWGAAAINIAACPADLHDPALIEPIRQQIETDSGEKVIDLKDVCLQADLTVLPTV